MTTQKSEQVRGEAELRLERLVKRFRAGDTTVLAMDNLTLEIPARRFFTLLGPSGCGKSTLLRCIAGLETPDAGDIHIGSTTVFSSRRRINVPPNKRWIGMVFQSYAIWPHMTVFKNVAFPLEVRKEHKVRERVMEALAMVELDKLADRYASRLSGGQQQRIAFARAVVAEPDLLLLDEPLSNLDAALREQMRAELRALQERLGLTTLYVTHDQSEALSMSDEIAVMRDGRFLEVATPEELYNRPRTVFAAQFIGGGNILEGRVAARAPPEEDTRIETDFGTLSSKARAEPGPVSVFIRPEKLTPVSGANAHQCGPNVLQGTLLRRRFVGDSLELEVRLVQSSSSQVLHCKSPPDFEAPGDGSVNIHVAPAHVYVLSAS